MTKNLQILILQTMYMKLKVNDRSLSRYEQKLTRELMLTLFENCG